MKLLTLIILFLFPIIIFAQRQNDSDKFLHKSIITKKDTVRYHIYSKNGLKSTSKVLLFFHGSGGEPLYSEVIFYDTVQVEENGEMVDQVQKKMYMGSSVPFNLNEIPEDYALVAISKKGVPFKTNSDERSFHTYFAQHESLDYRVWQGDEVIKEITKKYIKNPSHIVIVGHSEGSDVVAKLGHVNKQVTHIGFFAGGGNTQYYDFALFIQKEVQQGNMTQAEGLAQLDTLFMELKDIENHPNSTSKQWLGHAYKRWTGFNEPPIDNLLKVDKPLFVAVGGKDASVPVESSLLIPVEFIRHGKKNLTYKMYPEYDHMFSIPPESEEDDWDWKFMEVFNDFMKWVEENPS